MTSKAEQLANKWIADFVGDIPVEPVLEDCERAYLAGFRAAVEEAREMSYLVENPSSQVVQIVSLESLLEDRKNEILGDLQNERHHS